MEYVIGDYGQAGARIIYVKVGDTRNGDEMGRNERSHFF